MKQTNNQKQEDFMCLECYKQKLSHINKCNCHCHLDNHKKVEESLEGRENAINRGGFDALPVSSSVCNRGNSSKPSNSKKIMEEINMIIINKRNYANKNHWLPYNFTYKGYFINAYFDGIWNEEITKIQEELK